MSALAKFLLAVLIAQPVFAADGNPLNDPGFFPIGVWVQNPNRAAEYKAAGINTYVALWHGPTQAHLDALKAAGMKVVCSQNAVGLKNINNPIILAWMHGDEPDNAQSLGEGKGWGPPILPEVIQQRYKKMKEADSSRPVLLNMGQGVAWDNYIGRGVRRNHPEDYPEYIKGCDIASFDIYPAVHDNKEVAGKLEFVAKGVERLVKWTQGEKPVWNCIECTRISNEKVKPTPDQVRTEVWMALIHGSRGLIYFVHQFKPNFREAALLDDPEMVKAVTAINQDIQNLAPVLNSPTIEGIVKTESSSMEVPVATMVKKANGGLYIFAMAMRDQPTKAKFTLPKASKIAVAEVQGEEREIPLQDGFFEDDFKGYQVHRYFLREKSD